VSDKSKNATERMQDAIKKWQEVRPSVRRRAVELIEERTGYDRIYDPGTFALALDAALAVLKLTARTEQTPKGESASKQDTKATQRAMIINEDDILSAIAAGATSLAKLYAALSLKPRRDMRALDRMLQKLRKAGRIEYGKGGWRVKR